MAEQGQVAGWKAGSYQGSAVQEFKGGGLLGPLLILKRKELPAMRLNAPDRTEVEKYRLKKISDRFNLYASVLDANALLPEIVAEVQNGKFGRLAGESLASQAVKMLWFLLEFKWQQDAKMVQLLVPYPGEEQGEVDDLATIAPF